MASFFKKLFKSQSKSVLGIDIGSSSIKVVQLKKKGEKAVIETYGSLSLAPYAGKEIGQSVKLPNSKLSEALKDILREAETTTNIAGVAIPFKSSLMSVVEFPTDDKKKLEEMVPIEARKYIPVPISEVSLDWMVIPSEKKSTRPGEAVKKEDEPKTTEVLLVAIHNEVVTSMQDLVEKSSLDVRFFEIEIFSTIRSVLENTSEAVLIFDMGAASTKLYMVKRGVIHGSHTINRGSQDITSAIARAFKVDFKDAEKIKRGRGVLDNTAKEQMKEVVSTSLGHIFADTQRAINNFSEKYHENIEKIYMVGGGSTLKGLKELAEASLKKQIILGDAFAKIETPAFLEDVLKETGPEFAVAVGAGLRQLEGME